MSGITAILPAFNEEVAIGSMVLRTKQYANRVIVVDDGSSDQTAVVAAMAGAEVIRHPQNRGKGAALKTGFNFQLSILKVLKKGTLPCIIILILSK